MCYVLHIVTRSYKNFSIQEWKPSKGCERVTPITIMPRKVPLKRPLPRALRFKSVDVAAKTLGVATIETRSIQEWQLLAWDLHNIIPADVTTPIKKIPEYRLMDHMIEYVRKHADAVLGEPGSIDVVLIEGQPGKNRKMAKVETCIQTLFRWHHGRHIRIQKVSASRKLSDPRHLLETVCGYDNYEHAMEAAWEVLQHMSRNRLRRVGAYNAKSLSRSQVQSRKYADNKKQAVILAIAVLEKLKERCPQQKDIANAFYNANKNKRDDYADCLLQCLMSLIDFCPPASVYTAPIPPTKKRSLPREPLSVEGGDIDDGQEESSDEDGSSSSDGEPEEEEEDKEDVVNVSDLQDIFTNVMTLDLAEKRKRQRLAHEEIRQSKEAQQKKAETNANLPPDEYIKRVAAATKRKLKKQKDAVVDLVDEPDSF